MPREGRRRCRLSGFWRIARLLTVITPIIAGRTDVVDYVDLRYANGFAIGWSAPARDPGAPDEDEADA